MRGVIDFRQAEVHDLAWLRRKNVLLDEMEREDDVRLEEQSLQLYLSLVANGSLSEESFKKVRTHASNTFDAIVQLLRPWFNKDKVKDAEVNDLAELYKKVIGDLNDPEFAAIVNKQADELMSQADTKDPAVTQAEMIARRFEEKSRNRNTKRNRTNRR